MEEPCADAIAAFVRCKQTEAYSVCHRTFFREVQRCLHHGGTVL